MARKAMRTTYWVITIIFVLFTLLGAITELIGTESSKAVLTYLGYPLYLNYILGTAKILGSIALMQTKWKTIKEWAYAGFTIDVVGAMASFFFIGAGVSMQIIPLAVLIVLFVSYGMWKKLY
jgi:uncharacterized membrane protein